jgi:hypothetical protein
MSKLQADKIFDYEKNTFRPVKRTKLASKNKKSPTVYAVELLEKANYLDNKET